MSLNLYFLLYLSSDIVSCVERYNKKCKNLTANKGKPIVSLTHALVRDGTARYFRWRRGLKSTRTNKIPITTLTGKSKLIEIDDRIGNAIQPFLSCGCRVNHATVYRHSTGKIGGKSFTSGEKLLIGRRCGSVVTRVVGGRSVYGLIKQFYRVICECDTCTDFATVTWFPPPSYPDCDPLTIQIVTRGLDINNINQISVVSLNDIQPSRIGVEIDNNSMLMLRMDGTDTNPLFT